MIHKISLFRPYQNFVPDRGKKMKMHCIFFVFFLLALPCSAQEPVFIVGNKNIPEDALSRTEVKNIFLGKKAAWDNNLTIRFILFKNTEVHDAFVRSFLHRSPNQFRNYWRQMLFSGKGELPQEVSEEDALFSFLSNTPGAIGYARTSQVPDNVKVFSIKNN